MPQDLAAIAEAFAEAATGSASWIAAMDAAAQATDSKGALLLPLVGQLPEVPRSAAIAGLVEAYLHEGWAPRDERYRGLPAMRRRGAFGDLDYMSADEIDRSPYYQEFLRPHGVRWMAGVRVAAGEDFWCLAIQRTASQGPFSEAELVKLGQLSTHLSSAAALAQALGFVRAEGALDAFELSGTAVVLLDRMGQVVRPNRKAEALLGSGLSIVRRRLVAADRDATAALDRTLHALIWTSEAFATMAPVVVRRVGRRPMLVYPIQIGRAAADFFSPARAALVLVDLEERRAPPEVLLRQAFGLTPAEARLATRLATGERLEDATQALGIAKETGRVQLKGIFEKTDTHRQADLTALMAKIASVPEHDSLSAFGKSRSAGGNLPFEAPSP